MMVQCHTFCLYRTFVSPSVTNSLPLLLHIQQTFHTPSLGDEVFEIPPISLDPDPSLGISDAVAHFELSDGSEGTGGPSGSRSLVSNLVVEANDPSFASTFVNSGSQGLEQQSLGGMGQSGGGGALLSSSALVSTSPVDSHTRYCLLRAVKVYLQFVFCVSTGTGQLWWFSFQQFFPHDH